MSSFYTLLDSDNVAIIQLVPMHKQIIPSQKACIHSSPLCQYALVNGNRIVVFHGTLE